MGVVKIVQLSVKVSVKTDACGQFVRSSAQFGYTPALLANGFEFVSVK